jgi:hypothetical protein
VAPVEVKPGYQGDFDNLPSGFKVGQDRDSALPRIAQIKGHSDGMPPVADQQYIQDLIRNTDIPGLETFGDVRELHNAGMFRPGKDSHPWPTDMPYERAKSLAQANDVKSFDDRIKEALGPYATPAEFHDFLKTQGQ